MDEFDLESTIAEWEEQISKLEENKQRIEAEQDSMVKADWEEVKRRKDPDIEKETLQRCIEEIEACSTEDDLFRALAEWRSELDDRGIATADSSIEVFRNSIIRPRLRQCIEDVESALPSATFSECSFCNSQKIPTLDDRYSKGYRLECPEC